MENKVELANNAYMAVNVAYKFTLSLLEEAAVDRIKAYVEKYESETCALAVTQGLIAIRNIIQYASENSSCTTDYRFKLVKEEIVDSIENVNLIVKKIHKKRSTTPLSDEDKKNLLEIERAWKNFLSIKSENTCVENVITFLLDFQK